MIEMALRGGRGSCVQTGLHLTRTLQNRYHKRSIYVFCYVLTTRVLCQMPHHNTSTFSPFLPVPGHGHC